MPSWTELQTYARTHHKLSTDDEGLFRLIFSIKDDRTQLVSVAAVDVGDEKWIRFVTRVCKLDELKPEVALRKNISLATCALALEGDEYFCVRCAQLDTLDIEEFERILNSIAIVADGIEENATAADEN